MVPEAGQGILLPLIRLDCFSSERRLFEVETIRLTADEISWSGVSILPEKV